MYITTINPEVDKLLACYSCFRTNHPIGYFSTPVSTGLRYYNWLAQNRDKITNNKPPVELEDYQNCVLKPNLHDATEALNTLVTNGDIIVNPTSVGCISGWEPEDYANLWRRVIELNVNYLIFNKEWSYSDGCVYEFYVAQINGKKCYTVNKNEISLEGGLCAIKLSRTLIDYSGFTSKMLCNVIDELDK